MPPNKRNIRVSSLADLLFWALLFLSMLNPLFIAKTQAQSDRTADLAEAELRYQAGFFDDAIDLASRYLNKSGITESEKLKAYRLLALAYLAKDYIEQAKNAISKLLDLVPMYRPDPYDDPPHFIQIFEIVKSERQTTASRQMPSKEVKQKKGGSAKWFLIGGGVIVAGVGAALALGGYGNAPSPGPPLLLPTPPPFP